MHTSDLNVISLDRVKALQPSEAGSRSVTLRLSGHTLDLFLDLERALGSPGAMAYFRDGLWLAALAISHDAQGQNVKINVEYIDQDKKQVKENILEGFRLHALRKWIDRNLRPRKEARPIPLNEHREFPTHVAT